MYELDFSADIDNSKKLGKKTSGPPNRMNDLPYKEWMKYQKSFFRVTAISQIYQEAIFFFTKAVWEDGLSSRSLLITGSNSENVSFSESKRKIDHKTGISTSHQLIELLEECISGGDKFDFIIIDFNTWADKDEIASFIKNDTSKFSSAIRKLLLEQRYCFFLLDQDASSSICWEFSISLREHLRLRDEKIGITEPYGSVLNCLILQSADDERSAGLETEITKTAGSNNTFPSWIIPKAKPRKKNEILHPAKFPEPLVEEFIKIFTKEGDNVIDPMAGTGSTVIASIDCHRNGYGVELIEEFANIAKSRVRNNQSVSSLFDDPQLTNVGQIVKGNAADLNEFPEFRNLSFNYGISSPPYWSMLSNKGSENQKKRRDQNLKLTYSDDAPNDLGNIQDYDLFVDALVKIYNALSEKLVDGAILTIIVKNVKRDHIIYPLAWDLTLRLCARGGKFTYLGNTMWCQDDVSLKPFAVGIHWVSNTLHQYCLHFKKV